MSDLPLPPGPAFEGRRIVAASQEFVHSCGDDLAEVNELLTLAFGKGTGWCRVGPDVHTVGTGDHEFRLKGSTAGWHADLFKSSWVTCGELGKVPAEHRHAVAVYVDARSRLTDVPPNVEELRQHSELGGTEAVHAPVSHHLALLEDQLRALDALQVALAGVRRQPWASQLLSDEAQDIKQRQDCVSAALVEYHLGAAAGTRPNLWVWVQGFDLPGGFMRRPPCRGRRRSAHRGR